MAEEGTTEGGAEEGENGEEGWAAAKGGNARWFGEGEEGGGSGGEEGGWGERREEAFEL